MTITQFNKQNVRDIQLEAATALQAVAAKYGLKVELAGGTIGNIKTVLKFGFSVTDTGSEKAEFAKYAAMFNAKAEDYGKTAIVGGKQLTLVGWYLSRAKYPVRLRKADGKDILYTQDVLRNFGVAVSNRMF